MNSYTQSFKSILTTSENKVFSKLAAPQKIQDFLDALPINFEPKGETYLSPRLVLARRTAHCFEGALLAAAALAYHGKPPLLLDLRATQDEDDHVVALFRVGGLWGAISKTNHPVLRYRDPVYRSVRELAMSYFHEYVAPDLRKSLREFSSPFDLRRYRPKRWLIAQKKLQWLADALDRSHHFPIAPKKNLSIIRKASKIELKASDITEWKR